MAKATKEYSEYRVKLDLSKSEALTIQALLGRVMGSGVNRDNAGAIYNALHDILHEEPIPTLETIGTQGLVRFVGEEPKNGR